jgi:ATP-dependent Lon protease
VKKVIIPRENEKDLKDISDKILKDVELKMVEHMDEVIKEAIVSDEPILPEILTPPLGSIPIEEGLVQTNINLS